MKLHSSEERLFAIEDGKLRALPIKLPNFETNGTTSVASAKPPRKKIPLQPIKLPTIDDIKPSPIFKKPGSRRPSSRKDLFKLPPRVSQIKTLPSRLSIMKKSSRLTVLNPTILKREALIASGITPLIDLDEAERVLRRGNRNVDERIKSVLFPVINNVETLKLPSTHKYSEKIRGSPELSFSDEEFQRLEKTLENKENNNSTSTIVSKMEVLLQEDNHQFQLVKNHVKQVQDHVQQLYHHMNTYEKSHNLLVEQMNDLKATLIGSQAAARNTREIVFPELASLNKKDGFSPNTYNLRKSTLKKNFKTSCESNGDALKIKKAADMYNSFRNNCTALVTPSKNTPMRERSTSVQSTVRRNLSRKIQSQCLLLQDTPR